MNGIDARAIRRFRLRSHHLDAAYSLDSAIEAAGACGLQNTPPGAWETALRNRIPSCTPPELNRLLHEDKTLMQAWSFRGAPVVFPTAQSPAFLTALIPTDDEPWIYTRGITLALDVLGMGFKELLSLTEQVMPLLDECEITSKTTLDQTVADWIEPLLPASKRSIWSAPSMYGNPDTQTVGGAVASFLLRPCAFRGLVVFGTRHGASPSFTSFKAWTGSALAPNGDAVGQLVRKYLHCYGPATAPLFASWLGCSGKQARRMWKAVQEEMEPVTVLGKRAYILSADKESLFSSEPPQRKLLLLGAHDPYLDQRDRTIVQPDTSLHKRIWKTVANPGAIVHDGEIIGTWTSKSKAGILDVKASLWAALDNERVRELEQLAQAHANFRGADCRISLE